MREGNPEQDGGGGTNGAVYFTNYADTKHGGDGEDVWYSRAGADVLYGHGGDDTLNGQSGGDTLYGGAGADWIMPGDEYGAGNDVMWGGEYNGSGDGRADWFDLRHIAGNDMIYDYEPWDVLWVSGHSYNNMPMRETVDDWWTGQQHTRLYLGTGTVFLVGVGADDMLNFEFVPATY